jgi:D-lactate dehydrogenase
MRILFFDAHPYERKAFIDANGSRSHQIEFTEANLSLETAKLASGYPAVCAFVNDRLDPPTLQILADGGTQLIALRSAGFNHVNLPEAHRLNIKVVRVPAYSPHAVAEHAACLLLSLNRKICRANMRVRELNFSLEGLMGFDLNDKVVGVLGTGKIGAVFSRIMHGFGCRVIAHDQTEDSQLTALGVRYVSLDELYASSDVISLHVPLNKATHHMIDAKALSKMKRGVVLINTSRGALIDSRALIDALKSEHLGAAGLDVYEEEESVFFHDLSGHVLQDDVLARLLTFPNVLITSHQAFLTKEALSEIANTTLQNVSDFEAGASLINEVRASDCQAKTRSN